MATVWDLTDVLRYFQEDAEVAGELTSEEFRKLVNPDEELLKVLKIALEYQGFDPRTVMRQIIRNRKAYMELKKDPMQWDLANVNDDFRIRESTTQENKFTNNEPLSRDLSFLIMMFLLRNNHISKIIQKSIQGLSNILEMLKEKYDINDEVRRSGTALGSKDVTLPRMAGVMPSVAVFMFHSRSVKEIVPYISIPGTSEQTPDPVETTSDKKTVGVGPSVSHAICCPFLPSLHPKNKPGNTHIHALMIYVAVRMDDIIHKKEKNFTALSDLMTYYKAGFESPATPELSRIEVMKKVGLLSADGSRFSAPVIAISRQCYVALKDMRIEDPYHSVMLKSAKTGEFTD